MTRSEQTLDGSAWTLLVLLSVLWGASFYFIGVALKELPPLTIVMARAGLAALLMLPVVWWLGASMPRSVRAWWPFVGMAILNNVLPHCLITAGQVYIPGSLASVLNATTPLFSVLIMGAAGDEPLNRRRVFGVLLGVAGVAVLRGTGIGEPDGHWLGILLCLAAAVSYGFAGLWGRRMLSGVSPVTSTTCQLMASSVIMIVAASVVDRPWSLPAPGAATWAALIGFAALSTALAYVVFFEVLARAGATNVMLVTLLIPVTAIALGHVLLGETISARETAGALLIGCALLVVDGRVLDWRKNSTASSA